MKINFVCIGASKCATTWLYECLKKHPEIYIASPKDSEETAFFRADNFSKKINGYNLFFKEEHEKKLKGNFNVGYLQCEKVAERIASYNPEMKIIVSLRNPIERAYSHY
ncbi:MAG: sulfotransferase domain-containing protein, partial [Elusimicrobiota bacterium]